MSLIIPFSDACERNKDPILDVLAPYFSQISTLLEIGSGTAQHAVYFGSEHPNLQWQTSDQSEYIQGIEAQLQNVSVENVLNPRTLDVMQQDWGCSEGEFEAVYTANTLHIMNWRQVCAFFAGLEFVVASGGYLFVYGPFKYAGKFTSPSNQTFDQILRARGVGSAIREFEEINQLAEEQGFGLLEDSRMPANNQCLVWKKA